MTEAPVISSASSSKVEDFNVECSPGVGAGVDSIQKMSLTVRCTDGNRSHRERYVDTCTMENRLDNAKDLSCWGIRLEWRVGALTLVLRVARSPDSVEYVAGLTKSFLADKLVRPCL